MTKILSIIILLLFSIESRATQTENLSLESLSDLNRSQFDSDDIREERVKLARIEIIRSEGLRVSSRHGFVDKLNSLIDLAINHSNSWDDIFDFKFLQDLASNQLNESNSRKLRSLSLIYQPPIVTKYQNVRSVNSEQTIYRKADLEYSIEEGAKLSEQALDWRFFIAMRPNNNFPDINIGALPQNGEEQLVWEKAISEGWHAGNVQAVREMTNRVQRLKQTHKGMLEYIKLVEKGMLKPATISFSLNPTESDPSGQKMAINVVRYSITVPAKLNDQTAEWISKIFAGELNVRKSIK